MSEGAVGTVWKRYLIAVLLVTALSFLAGCVYYNTFYHAQAAAREAELLRESSAPDAPPGPAERELLERVAEKCGRVLQLYPDSSWADDALLLLGETRYYQGRYESAERRLTEFLSLHPDSELLPEAEYMLASVLLERGNAVSAESYLERLAQASPPHAFSDDALVLIGRARNSRKKHTEATEAYEHALERFLGSDRRAEIRFLSAENYEDVGDLDAAAEQYALVPGERGGRHLAFEARMRLAEVDLVRGRSEEALEVLADLERRTDDRDELDRVLLLVGSALEATGAVDDAIATYEGISVSHTKSEASAEAHYRIGLLQRDYYELLEEAIASFRKAKDEAPRSDVAELAKDAVEDIDKLEGLLAIITRTDEESEEGRVGGEDERAPEPGDTPEQVATPSGVVDDTTLHVTLLPPPDQIADGADTTAIDLAPGSADTGAFRPAVAAVDTTGIESAVATADTTDIESAVATADSTDIEEPEDEIAIARFRAAELYLFRFDDAERARTYYASVIEHHPESSLAPKAALAIAWILETRWEDLEGARAVYEAILVDYPDSDFSAAATEGLQRLVWSGSD
jgi:TolA-binding protein